VSGLEAPQPAAGLASAPAKDAGAAYQLTLVSIGAYAVAAVLSMRFAARPGPVLPGINAFFAAGVFVTEFSTTFLLFVRFRESRRWSILLLACAYLYSALMTIPHVLTFPDAILSGGSVLGSTQSRAWIFAIWILGFAALCLAAVMIEALREQSKIPRSGSATSTAVAFVVAAVAVLSMLAIMRSEWLPVLVGAHGWTRLNDAIICIAIAAMLASVMIILSVIRGRDELFLWLALALTVTLFGNVLSQIGAGPYTFGWLISRLSWVFSGSVLFLYFMGQFVRQQALLARRRDVLEQHVAERTADLSKTVVERDLLLREVHHRVKNNFQVVNSLINFQTLHAEEEETRTALRNLHGRVYALGLVHQRLMQSADLNTFDVRDFLADLCSNVAALAAADSRGIELTVEADPLQTDLDFAGPLGLLITELVSQAFAHFAQDQHGRVQVSLRHAQGAVTFAVSDDALREPELLELPEDEPLSRIVHALLKQLSGEFSLTHEHGTNVTVTVPHITA
jgi:two-component sensor histidine kinase